jgi:hypothetical protein
MYTKFPARRKITYMENDNEPNGFDYTRMKEPPIMFMKNDIGPNGFDYTRIKEPRYAPTQIPFSLRSQMENNDDYMNSQRNSKMGKASYRGGRKSRMKRKTRAKRKTRRKNT